MGGGGGEGDEREASFAIHVWLKADLCYCKLQIDIRFVWGRMGSVWNILDRGLAALTMLTWR